MTRFLLSLMLLLGLAACAEPVWAPDEEVARAHYVHDGPTSITLFTVISNKNGNGGHSALMINGSERVLFDPAGTWHHPRIPERNDVFFGITPAAEVFYVDYHARITWHVVKQEIIVPPAVAEAALRAVKDYGAVGKAMCTSATSGILAGLPGFETINKTMFPKKLMQQVAALPGVTETVTYDDDPEENGYIIARGI